jgi:hypothetical protein
MITDKQLNVLAVVAAIGITYMAMVSLLDLYPDQKDDE